MIEQATTSHAWLEARFAAIRPKALAALSRQFRDVDLAEEAFAIASVRALNAWQGQDLPDDPFAWLLKVGRNAALDIMRKNSRANSIRTKPDDPMDVETLLAEELDQDGLRDDVLRLMFICCHPTLNRQDQLSLALKIVAGMSVDEIARAFLIKSKTMEQRITRAKRAVALADVPFETPDIAERIRRFSAVSQMLYLLFNEGWSASSGDSQIKTPFCDEAIRLARLLLDLFPGLSELMSLLALFLFQHSRRLARLDGSGNLVSLECQDRSKWDRQMINEAKVLLQKAYRHGSSGPYQIQASIAAVHAEASSDEDTDWAQIENHYAALYDMQPSPVIRLNQAASLAKTQGPKAALAMIEPLASELQTYRWYHAARAAFHFDIDEYDQAEAAYGQALQLNPTEPESRYLTERIAICKKNRRTLSD